MYLVNFLFCVCFIALLVIGYFIFTYRKKNSQNNLINQQNVSGRIDSNIDPGYA